MPAAGIGARPESRSIRGVCEVWGTALLLLSSLLVIVSCSAGTGAGNYSDPDRHYYKDELHRGYPGPPITNPDPT
jgi:hypothetical protein